VTLIGILSRRPWQALGASRRIRSTRRRRIAVQRRGRSRTFSRRARTASPAQKEPNRGKPGSLAKWACAYDTIRDTPLRMRLLLVAGLSVALVAPAAAQTAKALLPRMVVPDASLARLAGGLGHKFAFFSTAADAAASTPDPNDGAADMRRLGRIAGYVRGRNAVGAFSRRAPKGLLVMGTSAILWRGTRFAAASIERDIADYKRLRGKALEEGLLVGFRSTKVSSLGSGARLLHIHARPTGGTDRFTTSVVFHVRSLRGNAIVVRSDRKNADTTARHLAEQLRRRMLATLRQG
jgi:hypothetical protein